MADNKIDRSILRLFLVLLIITSCSTSKRIKIADTEIETNFNESLKKWNDLKMSHNNSYEFEVRYTSWVGYRNTTRLVVKKGKVVAREFTETQKDTNNRFNQEEALIYKEDESNLNENEKGFKGVLLDQIYRDCGTKSLLANEEENALYFTVDGLGIIKSCGYSPKNCADDCSRGVYISNFKWLE